VGVYESDVQGHVAGHLHRRGCLGSQGDLAITGTSTTACTPAGSPVRHGGLCRVRALVQSACRTEEGSPTWDRTWIRSMS
jgi:hypothetical protein